MQKKAAKAITFSCIDKSRLTNRMRSAEKVGTIKPGRLAVIGRDRQCPRVSQVTLASNVIRGEIVAGYVRGASLANNPCIGSEFPALVYARYETYETI